MSMPERPEWAVTMWTHEGETYAVGVTDFSDEEGDFKYPEVKRWRAGEWESFSEEEYVLLWGLITLGLELEGKGVH